MTMVCDKNKKCLMGGKKNNLITNEYVNKKGDIY